MCERFSQGHNRERMDYETVRLPFMVLNCVLESKDNESMTRGGAGGGGEGGGKLLEKGSANSVVDLPEKRLHRTIFSMKFDNWP